MPEKKIEEVSKDIKDILETVTKLQKDKNTILLIQKDRDLWKKKYNELKLLYDKTWI